MDNRDLKRIIRTELDNVDKNPSEKQIQAGNYRKGHIRINGYDITVENAKGSYRKWKDDKGDTHKQKMQNDYGYFNRTMGMDGDAIDVFIGNNYSSKKIFVVDQKMNGKFDESKVMFCFKDETSAMEGYLRNYSDDWKGFWKITEVDPSLFRKWLYDGYKQRKPFHQYSEIQKQKVDESRESDYLLQNNENEMNRDYIVENWLSPLCQSTDNLNEEIVSLCENLINEAGKKKTGSEKKSEKTNKPKDKNTDGDDESKKKSGYTLSKANSKNYQDKLEKYKNSGLFVPRTNKEKAITYNKFARLVQDAPKKTTGREKVPQTRSVITPVGLDRKNYKIRDFLHKVGPNDPEKEKKERWNQGVLKYIENFEKGKDPKEINANLPVATYTGKKTKTKGVTALEYIIPTELGGDIFSIGNTKIPNDTLIINLESASMCSSTKFCAMIAVCYAKAGEVRFADTMVKRLRNQNNWRLIASELDDIGVKKALELGTKSRLGAMFDLIKTVIYDCEHLGGHTINYIRIDEAGDMFHPELIRAWDSFAASVSEGGWEVEDLGTVNHPVKVMTYTANIGNKTNIGNDVREALSDVRYLQINCSLPNIVIGDGKSVVQRKFFGIESSLLDSMPATSRLQMPTGNKIEGGTFIKNGRKVETSDWEEPDEIVPALGYYGYKDGDERGQSGCGFYYKCPCGTMEVFKDGGQRKVMCGQCKVCYSNLPGVYKNEKNQWYPVYDYTVLVGTHGSWKDEESQSEIEKRRTKDFDGIGISAEERGANMAKQYNSDNNGYKYDNKDLNYKTIKNDQESRKNANTPTNESKKIERPFRDSNPLTECYAMFSKLGFDIMKD